MNNIQLKVKLVSVNTEYVGQDAKIVVSGKAKFQFYDKGNTQTRFIAYRSYGQSALFLQNAGIDSVHVVSGYLNVYPPNEHNASHSMLLTVNNALPVVVTKTQPSPTAQPQPVDQPSPTAQSQPSDESNLPNEVNSDDPIPF